MLGVGTGMIFPTLTLSYQSAVEFGELGVATSLNQFCRSIGSTLGSALFGSILILRFLSDLRASLPDAVGAWLEGPAGAGMLDPQSLLNPSAALTLRSQLDQAFPDAPATADLVLTAIRASLGSALHLVFLICALLMTAGLVGSVLWREVPMRNRRSPPDSVLSQGGTATRRQPPWSGSSA
jgi:hypothetical protein